MSLGTQKYGNTEVDFDRLPPNILTGFAWKAMTHKLGNEVAAAVIAKRGTEEKDEDEDARNALTDELRSAMVARFYDGTIGVRIGGPRGNTIENIAFELAMKQAEATLAPKGMWPKPDKKNGITAEAATVIFAGEPHTREMLADLVLEKYNEKLMTEAKAVHADRLAKAKANKAAQVPTVDKVEVSAADLL